MGYQDSGPMIVPRQTPVSVTCGPLIDLYTYSGPKTALNVTNSGLSGAGADGVKLSKNGAALVSRKDAGTTAPLVTNATLGFYTVPLDPTDTNTTGRLQLIFPGTNSAGSYIPYLQDLIVVPDEVYQALVNNTLLADNLLPNGPAVSLIGRLNQLWARFFRRTELTGNSLKVYKLSGSGNTGVWCTQTITDNGSDQTIDPAV